MKNKSVTINDVARVAGVSKRTVSRVINSSSAVNEATRVKVQSVIDELQFEPSAQARGLASNRSFLIGLLFDDLNAAVLHPVLRGALGACHTRGFQMVLKPLNTQAAEFSVQLESMLHSSRIEGYVVLPPLANDRRLLDALQQKNTPYIRLGAKLADEPNRMVISRDRDCMRTVVDLFLARGAKNLALISGPKDRVAAIERSEGFIHAAKERNILEGDIRVVAGDFSYESGLRCAQQLLAKTSRPDAIFACNDQMAIAVLHVAADLGIKIPDDLLVVGYDNDPAAALMRPSLTTIERPNEAMAYAAVEQLVASLVGEDDAAERNSLVFTPMLIERQSTKRI
ncbi:MAG: LacI family DNA-binding transcriptional regulator [Halieaceae bacterium]|nr:LacI family DNA-binding transcriptional regulator [Halieaceae bacterium]